MRAALAAQTLLIDRYAATSAYTRISSLTRESSHRRRARRVSADTTRHDTTRYMASA